jgi:hypothetical protein
MINKTQMISHDVNIFSPILPLNTTKSPEHHTNVKQIEEVLKSKRK